MAPRDPHRTPRRSRPWPAAAGLLPLVLAVGCGGGGGGGPPLAPDAAAVSVLSADSCPAGNGSFPGASCLLLRVEVDDMPPIDVELRVIEPEARLPTLGTVVLGSGGPGTRFFEELAGGEEQIADLLAEGFRVLDRRWTSGWIEPGPAFRAGSRRHAELLRWIFEQVHTGGAFCAVGTSGGASEIAYALTTWGLADLLDVVVLTSGPVQTRVDFQCFPPSPAWSEQCLALVPPGTLDCGEPLCSDEEGFVCTLYPPDTSAVELEADSVLHPGAALDWPTTQVHVLVGALDCGVTAPQAALFQQALPGPSSLQLVPGTPHAMQSTPEGRAAVVAALLGAEAGPASTPAGWFEWSLDTGQRSLRVTGPLRR